MSEAETMPTVASREAGPSTKRRGSVFVIQGEDTGKFKKAERFGDLIYLMHRDAFPDNADERIETMRHIMLAKLRGFNPARDYILLTGDPLAIAMCVLVLSAWYAHTDIPCLKWDKLEQDYYAVTISI